MTTMIVARRSGPNAYVQLTALSIAVTVLSLIWAGFDARQVLGDELVWAKPFKFGISLTIHFATLAIIVRQMSPAVARGRLVQGAGWFLVVAFLFEMTYVVFQAAQARQSHFNQTSTFYSAMYGLMGVGAVILLAVPVAVGWAARSDPAIGPVARVGIWWGACAAFVLTLIIAGTMSSSFSHFVGGPPPEGAATFPIMGWSGAVGDLRAPHFFATHMFQLLMIVGFWADWAGQRAAIVRIVAVLWGLLTLSVFAQALMGLPLIRL